MTKNATKVSWKSIEHLFFSYISYKSVISEDLFAYIPCNRSHATKETLDLQEQMCKIKETTNFPKKAGL